MVCKDCGKLTDVMELILQKFCCPITVIPSLITTLFTLSSLHGAGSDRLASGIAPEPVIVSVVPDNFHFTLPYVPLCAEAPVAF